MCVFYVQSTTLGAGETSENKTDKCPCPHGADILVGKEEGVQFLFRCFTRSWKVLLPLVMHYWFPLHYSVGHGLQQEATTLAFAHYKIFRVWGWDRLFGDVGLMCACEWLGRGMWKLNSKLGTVKGNGKRRNHLMVLEGDGNEMIHWNRHEQPLPDHTHRGCQKQQYWGI